MCQPIDSGSDNSDPALTNNDGVPMSCPQEDPCEGPNPPFYCNLDEEEFAECVKEATVEKFSESTDEASEYILPEIEEADLTLEQSAYFLSTIRFESRFGARGGMIEDNPRVGFYEDNTRLGNDEPGDGARYIGRGYIQLTGKANYEKLGDRLGIDLVSNPDLLMNKSTAARVAVIGMKEGLFTGVGLDDYINNSQTDYTNARRIVNGTDKAEKFANKAEEYKEALIDCAKNNKL